VLEDGQNNELTTPFTWNPQQEGINPDMILKMKSSSLLTYSIDGTQRNVQPGLDVARLLRSATKGDLNAFRQLVWLLPPS